MNAPSSIGVFSFGRTQSQRCPNKMLRPFAGTTLTDIILDKLSTFAPQAFFAGVEEEFHDKCQRHGVPFVRRDAQSAAIDEPITEILSFLRDVPYTHLLIVNGCLPFLRTLTIAGFLEDCVQGGLAPAFAVTRRQNHFISMDRRPLNFPIDLKTINTKTVEPVLEFAHALYFFEKEYFFANGRYWDWRTVRLIETGAPHEMLDIDTEEDFAFAETVWKGSVSARDHHSSHGPLAHS
jgi:molybdopterin-guanine dinucleotide biosynthesis protein A